jgi:hypothetical protein
LWPAATVSALGLSAPAPDSPQAMSIAALELLAAQAVAEIGTYAAFAERPFVSAASGGAADVAGEVAGSAPAGSTAAGARAFTSMPSVAPGMPSLAEPAEADVLGAAAAMVPTARRARFDALYVALSQSPSGRTWSPAARAARALALAGRGEEAPVSAYERAATAWDVLPVVYATDGMSIAEIDAASATGTLPALARSAARARGADMPTVDGRSGLSGLRSRAGEALGSYVAPSTGDLAASVVRAESSSSSTRERERDMPTVYQRGPTAAQELVQTGRSAERDGGGHVDIPPWFEAAARKMLGDRNQTSSSDGGFSLAELTLVTAAPASQIAASSRASSHSQSVSPSVPSAATDKSAAGAGVDIDQIANDVYRQILVLMDTARSRNGEPYL